MDEKNIWLKINGSIIYYFKCYNRKLSDEEIWLDYIEYGLPDIDGDGFHTYLDKQTLERIVVDEKMMDKAKTTFMERLEKRKSNKKPVKEEQKVLAPIIDFLKYMK